MADLFGWPFTQREQSHSMNKDIIAIVGAGTGGHAIIETLLKIPSAEIRYVYDINQNASGILLAQKHNIPCFFDSEYSQIAHNDSIDVIFEVTGNKEILAYLKTIRSEKTNLIAASSTKIIFHLLETQGHITEKLEEYKNDLEKMIASRTDELAKTNKNLVVKCQEFEQLNEKLQQINNEKTKYLLQATHQLKAPFAAIQSYTDLIIEGFTGEISDKTMDVVKKIKTRCELLSSSIKEMLELANLKSYVTDNVKIEKVNIKQVVDKIIEQHQATAGSHNIKIEKHYPAQELFVYGNSGQTEIALSILVDNAINYSFDDGAIEVNVITEQQNVIVEVKDFGIGIPSQNLEKIFKEYFRCNNAVKKNENGSGLGLAIVAEIAAINNYTIQVASEENRGSSFFISMPLV